MKIHRFWVEHFPATAEVTLNSPELVHQVKDVLQLKLGERIQLFNQQEEKQAELLRVSKKEVQVRVGQDVLPLQKSPTTIHLAISLLKGDSWEEIIRECTPLGIQDIQPLVCNRSIVRDLTPTKLQRYLAIAKEATEQSGWRHIPQILPVQQYSNWIKHTSSQHTFLLNHPGTPLTKIDLPQELTLGIGPEGGWTETELAAAEEQGVQSLSLTEATLTARLAPVVACSAVLTLASQN